MNIEDLQWRLDSIRHGSGRDHGLWGSISTSLAQRLVANKPSKFAEVRLLPDSTVRSLALTLLDGFKRPELAGIPTSRLWTTILSHFRRERSRLLIVDGVHHLDGNGERKLRSSTEIRDLLKSLLLHGIPFMCVGPESGARFLLEDVQIRARYLGSVSPSKGYPT
ncbi:MULTISPECIES: TniB family NTP-binding protein [unclassified Mesorhizobium]|uniref:TniB family NTP-binding protein n=1 Tax=Mesorhizobium sp. CO1-1-9 TaxID=2876630 RepID=UPI001127B5C9|nr:ATP-binding protein [Mesorhizobium sp. CO1-1-9]TPK11621.1 hypothetical protein FJ543_19735 [Mesorhizobium sp. B2-5-7]